MRTYVLRHNLPCLALVAIAGVPLACGAAPGADESSETASSEVSVIDKALCAVVDATPTVKVGPVTASAGCNIVSSDDLEYLGSSSQINAERDAPRREAEALYCTLKGLDGATASALYDSSTLGRFGVASRARVYNQDPTALHLTGERVGKLYAFGVGLDLEQQEFDWAFPTEVQHQPTPPIVTKALARGQYALMQTSGAAWSIDGSALVTTGGPTISTKLDFASGAKFGAQYGDTIAASAPPFVKPNYTSWNYYVNQCNACKAQNAKLPPGVIGSVCATCPSSQQIAEHAFTCEAAACTDAIYRNLGDGILPYRGSDGATGPFIFDDNYYNWWHFGLPGVGAELAAQPPAIWPTLTEPVTTLSSTSGAGDTTTQFSLDIALAFDVGVASIDGKLDTVLSFTDGVAVREEIAPQDPDSKGPPLVVKTSTALDAQADVAITADLQLYLDIPFVSNPVIDAHFDLYTPDAKRSSDNATSVAYWTPTFSSNAAVQSYSVRGTDEPNGFSSCLAVPPVTGAPVTPGSPASFSQQVYAKASTAFHPCHVNLCTESGSTLTHRTCEWNAATKSLACTVISGACTCEENSFEMCDATGKAYAPDSTSKQPAPSCSVPR